jgi:hypothetical protein
MLYEGLSFKEYCELPGVNQSTLKVIRRSLAHFKACLEYERKATDSQEFGKLYDCLVLTPELFDSEYVVVSELPKKGSKARIELEASSRGKEIVIEEDRDIACRMRDVLLNHSIAANILEDSKKQIAITWDVEGITCKGRPDIYSPRFSILADLKTTRDARAYQFSKDAEKYGYFLQLEFYRQGLYHNAIPVTDCLIIAQESTPPFGVVVHKIPDSVLDWARAEIYDLISCYKYASENDTYPCYPEIINILERPKYGNNDTGNG